MKERGILFSAPMVRAILAGTKTQTRRPLKVQPLDVLPMKGDKAGVQWIGLMQREPEPNGTVFGCRYGKAGDRLWVRETWRRAADGAFDYRAGDWSPAVTRTIEAIVGNTGGWKPSIHMPRNASRITLEVTGVRVERLQSISSADAIKEGIEACPHGGEWRDYLNPTRDMLTPRNSYRSLWESINGPGSWDANPFVWVVEFRRI